MKNAILITGLTGLILSGCANKKDEHGHEHGPDPLAYTRYSDKMEVFVEFKPLVVGSTSNFAAHLTVLGEKFIPLSEGAVTLSLVVGDKGIKQTSETPAIPGIYRLALKPVTPGVGQLVFDIKTANFSDQITIANVTVHADQESAAAVQQEGNADAEVSYLKEQAWKVEFANAPVRKQPFSDIIKTSGQVLSAPGDEMTVIAKSDGIVHFSGGNTIIGTAVEEGTQLFTITGGDLAAGNIDAAYIEAKANSDKAKGDYDRASELVKDKIVSQKDFEDARLKYENAQTAFNLISKNYSANGKSVTAPMSGYVKNIFVTGGQFVSMGTPLATVSKNKKLILQANVSQKYFERLNRIVSANFRTTDSNRIYNTEELNGKVVSFGKSASANAPFIPVTFAIDNAGPLVPGSVAEVYLKSSPIPGALVIPVGSLIEEQGNFFVYVQTGGESFQKRRVEPGASDGINVQVLSGIDEGERVVTKGAFQIKLSTASGTLPAHGHEH